MRIVNNKMMSAYNGRYFVANLKAINKNSAYWKFKRLPVKNMHYTLLLDFKSICKEILHRNNDEIKIQV